jgi:hypothetical protein
MEIDEKIGDIAGLALSIGQMGNLYFQKKEFETALKFFIQAFQVFTKLGSPYAQKAGKDIETTRKKLPKRTFKKILKEFDLNSSQLQ